MKLSMGFVSLMQYHKMILTYVTGIGFLTTRAAVTENGTGIMTVFCSGKIMEKQ